MKINNKSGEFVATILRYLYRKGKIGPHVYQRFELVVKCLPAHLRGDAKKIIKELARRGLLTASKHPFGVGISLNKYKLTEIEAIIKKYFPSYAF